MHRSVAVASLLLVAACSGSSGPKYTIPTVDMNATEGTGSKGGDGADSSSTPGKTAGAGATTGTRTASAPSCETDHGGNTCGPNGDQDCCAIAQQGDAKIGKYMVTAGRMRAFIGKVNGDVASFVKTLPDGKWDASWPTDALPSDVDSANAALGPENKKACEQGSFTGHTYWTPKTDDDFSDFDQATLDEKALNCVPWELMQALCAFDGGHIATVAELKSAFTNGGATRYPWGDENLPSLDAPDPQDRLNLEGAFNTDPLPANFRPRDDGSGFPAEISFLIAPPGRFPNGDNQVGIADSAGNLLEWAGDRPRQFIWKGDFEDHAKDAATFDGGYIWMDTQPFPLGFGAWIWGQSQLFGNAGNADQKDGYYAIGGRCAF